MLSNTNSINLMEETEVLVKRMIETEVLVKRMEETEVFVKRMEELVKETEAFVKERDEMYENYNKDQQIKFKFANNKKAILYNFKSAASNNFTLGISDTSQWTFAPKQPEQPIHYDYK